MIINGSIRDAFVHLTGLGIASIVEDVSGDEVRIGWKGQNSLELITSNNLSDSAIAEMVHEHAKNASEAEWLNNVAEYSVGESKIAERSPLSPRIGQLDSRGYSQNTANREELIDSVADSILAQRLIGALGEPAYWAQNRMGLVYPDCGASCWEMITRNQGKDFFRCRLAPLASSVASRSVEEVRSGLVGESVKDEVGKDALDSRTATGLRKAGRSDNAQAWCALWGLNLLPTCPVVLPEQAKYSNVTGAIRGREACFVFPIIEEQLPLARWSAFFRNASLYRQAMGELQNSYIPKEISMNVRPAGQKKADEIWLQTHGCTGIVLFKRFVKPAKPPAAPEFWAEEGEIELFGKKTIRAWDV